MARQTLLFILLCLTSLNAAITLTDETKKKEHFSLQYFYDDSRLLHIEDIEKINFTQTIPSQFTKGYRDGTAWFKFEITNQSSNEDFILYFTEPFWSKLDLYDKQEKGWNIQKNGLDVLLKDRKINDNLPAYQLHIPPGETRVYFLKGETMSGQIGEFKLFSEAEYFKPTRFSLSDFYILYAAVLFIIAILNTYSFLVTKSRVYLYYIGYILFFILFTAMKSGSYLRFGVPGWDQGLHVVGAFVVMMLALFSGSFLDLKKHMPLIDTVFKTSVAIIFLFALLISFDIPYSSLLFNIYASLFFTLLLIVAIKMWRSGHVTARYYLIALIIYMPTMGLMTLTFNGLINNTDFSRYAFLGGSFIEIIFFTLILAYKFRETDAQKLAVQHQLIEEKLNNEKHLKDEIDKQTHELKMANEELLKQTEELIETKEQLIIEASTDPLTSLHNRRYFCNASDNSFSTAKRYEQNLSVMMIDIDGFKQFNDIYGHAVGDLVIQSAAELLKTMLRESDIIARYGGEEFVVLLHETDIDEALSLAERIREQAAQKEIALEQAENINFTFSIGVTQMNNKEDETIEEVIKRADKAMYKAKHQGKNAVAGFS